MQYFQAVQIGKQRANKAQMILFDISGFAMLTLTTKKIDGKFVPVGEESFATVIKTSDGFVIILVDEDGFTKAQTKALEKEEAKKILRSSDSINIVGKEIVSLSVNMGIGSEDGIKEIDGIPFLIVFKV